MRGAPLLVLSEPLLLGVERGDPPLLSLQQPLIDIGGTPPQELRTLFGILRQTALLLLQDCLPAFDALLDALLALCLALRRKIPCVLPGLSSPRYPLGPQGLKLGPACEQPPRFEIRGNRDRTGQGQKAIKTKIAPSIAGSLRQSVTLMIRPA